MSESQSVGVGLPNLDVGGQYPFVPNQMAASNDLARLVLDTDKLIEKITGIVRNEVLQSDGSVKRLGEPLANEKFLQMITALLNSHLGNHIFMSSIGEEEFSVLYKEIHMEFTRNITCYYEDYCIYPPHIGMLIKIVMTPIYLALTRARGQNEKEFFGRIASIGYQQVERPQENKQGIISRVLGR